jgi:hypothetical protein
MADIYSPRAIAKGVLGSVRRDLFVKGMLGLGRLAEVFRLADPGRKLIAGGTACMIDIPVFVYDTFTRFDRVGLH